MAKDLKCSVADLIKDKELRSRIEVKNYVTDPRSTNSSAFNSKLVKTKTTSNPKKPPNKWLITLNGVAPTTLVTSSP